MTFWTAENLAQITGGRWLAEPANAGAAVRGVSTDSRTAGPGQAFVAIRGEKFDGHDFVDAVGRAGASVVIVSAAPAAGAAALPGRPGVLLVGDTLAALHQIAAAYRDHLGKCGCKVIAVTGSNGKTTTRHLIHSLLSARLPGTQSPKSFNNHIGVPLTLLGAGENDRFVVVEIGTNHPGEIAALSAIARPDAAVITSIGQEHMEFFKTLAGVAAEEARVLGHVAPGGLMVVSDDPLLDAHVAAAGKGRRVVRFGESSRADMRLTDCRPGPENTQEFTINAGPVQRIKLLGRHNALNAMAALAVGEWMGLGAGALTEALGACTGVPMRLTVMPMGRPPAALLLINDAYNANPDSMAAALRTLVTIAPPAPGSGSGGGSGASAGGRRIAILGDMLELGEAGPDAHRQIGTLLAQIDRESRQATPGRAPGSTPGNAPGNASGGGIDQVIVIGRLALFMAEALSRAWPSDRVHAFPLWDASLPERVAGLLRAGDVVLLKASRGMGLERLLPEIQKRFD